MPQLKSSTALTTSRHTNSTRSYGRGRRVTIFTAPAPVHTDPARDLVAAVYGWGRIAVPVAVPAPCPVAWCVDCSCPATTGDEDMIAIVHGSAFAIFEADSFNGHHSGEDASAHVRESAKISVRVERGNLLDGEIDDPTSAYLALGGHCGVELGVTRGREVAAAIRKARAGAEALELRDGVRDGETGVVSVVRCQDWNLQIGAVFTVDGAAVFLNAVEAVSAGYVRRAACGEGRPVLPESWDLDLVTAAGVADALDAATALAIADRAALAVTA